MELFAQQRGGDEAAVVAGVLVFYAVIIAVALFVQIMFLLSVSRCLKQVAPRNRRMEPGQVWLCLIPLFGFVWTIIMMLRVAESLKDEFYDRGLRGDGDFGQTLGIVYIVSSVMCGPVALICFIMYWVKIAGYTRTLAGSGGYDDYEDGRDEPRPRRPARDDDYDDRDERRPRRDDYDDDYDDRRGRSDRDDDDRPRRPWDRGAR